MQKIIHLMTRACLALVIIASTLTLSSATAFSQLENPVTWSVSAQMLAEQRAELTFTATIEEGWNLYAQDNPTSPPATVFSFEESPAYTRQGLVNEPPALEKYDPNFQTTLRTYKKQAIFRQLISLEGTKPLTINSSVYFMSCSDNQCVTPETTHFQFNSDGTSMGGQVLLEETIPEAEASFDLEDIRGLLWFFTLAFMGGMAALLTPCVFPMIPLTITFFLNNKEERLGGKLQALVYGLSIIAISTSAGTVLALFMGPEFANFLSTHWLPNILFFLVFLFFAAALLGMFSLELPQFLVKLSDNRANKGGFTGTIFMALTLVLVSFSCTGPIIGAILVESAGGAVLKPVIGMLGFSLAFALPFTFFAFFPALLEKLPKSGSWLNSVKVLLGFFELAMSFKFLSIADQTYHWGILDREIFLALWIVIFSMQGFYLLGKLKFAYDSTMPHISVPRLFLAIITFAFVVYLIPGMFGAPLKGLAGYLPPQHTLDFDLPKIILDRSKKSASTNTAQASGCPTAKHQDLLNLPHGLSGYFDLKQALTCARRVNKPIFIDFTGHGCVNCREMEARVWSNPAVLERLERDYVVVALYVDDKQLLPKAEWRFSTFDKKLKKSIGAQNADLQATMFQINAQPYYILLGHDGDVLAEPRGYDLDADAFATFLDTGVSNFKKGSSVGRVELPKAIEPQ